MKPQTDDKPKHQLAKRTVHLPKRDVSAFFSRRGDLNLKNDTSAHRRYTWMFEDLLQ